MSAPRENWIFHWPLTDIDRIVGALDEDVPDGVPTGVVGLPVLRNWLLAHPRAYAVRDAVWCELIRRARLDGPAWVIAAVAVAMPALRRSAERRLGR